MNGTSREPLSSECIIKCMVDAYAYEGDALVVKMSLKRMPKPGFVVCLPMEDPEDGYEFVVIGIWKYVFLLDDDVVVESPRSGGPSHDKCALDAFNELQAAGYEVLAWRPICKEAIPYMDRDGNTLPIDERPPVKTPEELEDTAEDRTVTELRKQILQLKEKLRSKEICEIRLQMSRFEDLKRSHNSELTRSKGLERYRGAVRENVKELNFLREKVKELEVVNDSGNKDQHLAKLLEGLLDKMALSTERRKSTHLELKAAVLQKELDLGHAFTELHLVFDNYKDEKARNPQSLRLVELGSDLKGARDRVSETSMAMGRAKTEMEAAEQNLLEE
ncbi:hypothetical protein FCIRC_7037 [Fusarium circinatum]|uniref:Uncharacterized protein n=1 Tax=Fusarium circinatum TaxID=48490 RepID=A0A8H5TTX0_FUSCI|nr:hypothetical protein FCIRC_7037 [Fusarium circinatum]